LKNYFKAELSDLPNPERDIFISSVSWAFRNRIRRETTLKMPFACFRLVPGGIHPPEDTWVKNWKLTHGVFLKEIGAEGDRIKVTPFQADYGAIFWSNKYYNCAKVFQHFFEQNYDDLIFEYNYTINGVEYCFEGSFEFTNLELDPEFNEDEELQKEKLHSVDLSFQIKAFTFSGLGVQLADSAQLEMFYSNANLDDEDNLPPPDRTSTIPPPP
jgi:hypothetical protein